MESTKQTVQVRGSVSDYLPYKYSKLNMYWQMKFYNRTQYKDMVEVYNDDLVEAYTIIRDGGELTDFIQNKISSHKIGTQDMELIIEMPELLKVVYLEERKSLFMWGLYETLYDYYRDTRGKNAQLPYFLMDGVYRERYDRIVNRGYSNEYNAYELREYASFLNTYLSDLFKSQFRHDFIGRPLPYVGSIQKINKLSFGGEFRKIESELWDATISKLEANRNIIGRIVNKEHQQELSSINNTIMREAHFIINKNRG